MKIEKSTNFWWPTEVSGIFTVYVLHFLPKSRCLSTVNLCWNTISITKIALHHHHYNWSHLSWIWHLFSSWPARPAVRVTWKINNACILFSFEQYHLTKLWRNVECNNIVIKGCVCVTPLICCLNALICCTVLVSIQLCINWIVLQYGCHLMYYSEYSLQPLVIKHFSSGILKQQNWFWKKIWTSAVFV